MGQSGPQVRAAKLALQSMQGTLETVGPASLMIQLYNKDIGAWVDGWSTILGTGMSYSRDGVTIEFTTLSIGGVRMTSFLYLVMFFLHFIVWDGKIDLSLIHRCVHQHVMTYLCHPSMYV